VADVSTWGSPTSRPVAPSITSILRPGDPFGWCCGQLDRFVDAGNTVVVIEHEMDVVAGADWVIDLGPGAGTQGGQVVAAGTPEQVAAARDSRTAPYLRAHLAREPIAA
jgi:hypothetical protein